MLSRLCSNSGLHMVLVAWNMERQANRDKKGGQSFSNSKGARGTRGDHECTGGGGGDDEAGGGGGEVDGGGKGVAAGAGGGSVKVFSPLSLTRYCHVEQDRGKICPSTEPLTYDHRHSKTKGVRGTDPTPEYSRFVQRGIASQPRQQTPTATSPTSSTSLLMRIGASTLHPHPTSSSSSSPQLLSRITNSLPLHPSPTPTSSRSPSLFSAASPHSTRSLPPVPSSLPSSLQSVLAQALGGADQLSRGENPPIIIQIQGNLNIYGGMEGSSYGGTGGRRREDKEAGDGPRKVQKGGGGQRWW
ncbi:hypothetical protein BDY24DRAFT_390798 [Mrakia frigida]|uniref:uncharacterized protein n=1 Tax=Mrakia frigida TaxID=29902 RepID=UPI003FCC1F11